MSTNIHINGTRTVQVLKTNKQCEQTIKFEPYQTPSKVTFEIMQSDDKVQTYKDWVMSVSDDVEEAIYASLDIFEENEPIGTRTYNPGREHLIEFDAWLTEAANEGYAVEFAAW